MKKSKLLKEVASVKVYKSFNDAFRDVGETTSRQHFDTTSRIKKEAKRQKDRARAFLTKAQKPDSR